MTASKKDKGRVRRLPGTGCEHYLAGRCLYEERLNPGLDESRRCAAMQEWMREHDDFLNRAEAFGLDEQRAGELWSRKLERLSHLERDCPGFEPTGCAVLPECGRHLDGLCVSALPPCQGKCRHFKLLINEDKP
ncbi:MAG: hypothetical protein ACOCVM_07490 [Desulfovibrionaceae bacterium]